MSSQKSTKLNQGPSNAAGRSPGKKDQVQNTASIALDVVANIAEASDILAPLKAACRATKSIIDVKQAIDDNQGDWSDLYPPQDRVVDEAFSQPLVRYVEVLEDIHCAIVNDRHTRPRTSHGAFTAIGK
ncbi:SubName: Full=Related to archipelago beta form (F-box-WD40 repeat protein) {ECO:0000313/EMBL:CCA74347.1}, partial [Serendipita indica DSM 11827]